MLIYLDANIVQYCADYRDFVFDREGSVQPSNGNPDSWHYYDRIAANN